MIGENQSTNEGQIPSRLKQVELHGTTHQETGHCFTPRHRNSMAEMLLGPVMTRSTTAPVVGKHIGIQCAMVPVAVTPNRELGFP